MKHCGMDVHAKSTTVEILDEATGEVTQHEFATERTAVYEWLSSRPRMQVVLEASTISHWIADVAEEAGHEVVVVDPNRTKAIAIAGGYKKTDRLDAAMLAWLSAKDVLTASHRPSVATRERRQSLILRQRLVRSRGDLVRSVRSVLASNGLRLARRAKRFAEAVRVLPEFDTFAPELDGALRAIELLDEEIENADRRLATQAKEDAVVQLLQSAPGVGPVTATAFRVVIEEPWRFRSGRQVAAYLGLVPSVHQSGAGPARMGRISKHGDKMMRSLLVEAAHVLLQRCRQPSDLRAWGLRVSARVGKKKAAVAVARKLSVGLGAMWRKETAFRPVHGSVSATEMAA